MAGVNRSNVAVTDTFDTWRIRTNEVNTTLNQATNAITANTIVFRDDDSSYIANAATLNTISVTHNTTTTALSVTSGLAASADGSKASILTTGGLYATLSSKFAADLTVSTDMTVSGNTIVGSASGDIVTINATLTDNIIPTVNIAASGGASTGSMLGSTAKHFAHIYNGQQTIIAASGVTANVFSVSSAAGAANTATLVNNSLTTGTILSATSTSADTTARKLVQITNDNALSVATTALSIQSDGGRGIFVDSNLAAGLPSLEIDSEHTTANAVIVDSIMTTGTIIDVTGSALTTGSALRVESTGASTGTRNIVDLRQEHASATGSTVLNVLADEGYGVKITSTAGTSNASLDIVSSHTTKNTFNITAASLTTGSAFNIVSDSSSTGTRNLANITNDNVGATGTTALSLTVDAGRGVFIDSNLAAGGYAIEIDSEQTTTNVAKIASIATSGTLVEVSATGVLTGNVLDITADAATTGKGIAVSMDGLTTGSMMDLTSTATSTGTRDLVKITNDAAAATGTTALSVQSDGGRGLFIDSNLAAGLPSLEIDSEHTTANTVIINGDALTTGTAIQLNADALTTGAAIYVDSDSAATDTRSLATIINNNALAVAATGLTVQSDGGRGIFVDSNLAAGLPSLEIDSEHTTANTIHIASDALTTGSALTITSAGTHSSNLVSFISDGAATGPTLHLRSDATAAGTKIFQVANSSADVFSVTQAGIATIGSDFVVTGNLVVSGATTEINTTTTVVKDKTLVLGTQSAVTAGATYTAATPPVVTSASHGLSTGNIIFLVTATGTGLTSSQTETFAENIVKVTVTDGNTFTLADKDGTNIVSNSTGAISWVGPQTDALVDDAGIYVPGDTGVHKIKWDDTDNYWEVNASFNIDDTGQFVLPKGTSAQKPASSATATVPAATTGALRYNTDNSKIEGVTVGTTYENLSTETFATAIAIALG
jgi:hypothetical protein